MRERAAVFESARSGQVSSARQVAEQRRIEALEAKVREKNEVLAELMSEHVALKNSLGEI
jgi:transposase